MARTQVRPLRAHALSKHDWKFLSLATTLRIAMVASLFLGSDDVSRKRDYQPPHRRSHIDDVRTASAMCLVPQGSKCAVKTQRLSRLANNVTSTVQRDNQNLCSLFE